MFCLTDILIYVPLVILVWLPIGLYCWSLYINAYWKRNKIPFVPAKPIVGNLFDMFRFRKCAAEIFADMYNDRNAIGRAFVGLDVFHKPALLIRDPELIKQILVKDFAAFSDRHASSDIHSDVLGSTNLFLIPNPAWKVIRARLTPFFASGKIKQMFLLMKHIENEMNDTLMSLKNNGKSQATTPTDIYDMMGRYTTDVIASCAFGVEANSLKNPESEFRKNGKTIFDFNWHRAIEGCCLFFFPEIIPYFKFKKRKKPTNTTMASKIVILFSIAVFIATIGTITSNPTIGVCLRNCAQCKKMYGNYFEGQMCADACVKFKGKIIPDCEDIG